MASPAASSRPSSAIASKATNNDNNDPYRAQKPVAEIDVVLVLDASPGPERWVHQVWNYFRHLMEHLTARGQHVSRIRLGVITYGRVASSGAMRRLSPIIKQIPFSMPDVVMSALRDQHDSFGIGIGTATSSGGMAVLEALVAAIEMCAAASPGAANKRLLAKRTNSSSTNVTPPVDLPRTFHVALFSHSEPNTSAKASFNITQDLDNLSWDALPDEFKRRKIQLHMVLMAPSPALALLHKRACFGTSGSAWFPMPPGHSFLVSGATSKPMAGPVAPGTNTNTGSPRKRPFSAVDNGARSAAPLSQQAITKPSPAGIVEGTPGTSPNKRPKTTHESPRSLNANKPGHLNVPPFDTRQAAAVAAVAAAPAQGAASASNGQQNGATAAAGGVRTAEEHRVPTQRANPSAQAQPSNPGPPAMPENPTLAPGTSPASKSPGSAKPAPSTANAGARGKAGLPGGNNGHQRQQGQNQNPNATARNVNPHSMQGAPTSGTRNNANVAAAGPSNALPNPGANAAPNPAPGILNLTPSEILLTSANMQKAGQNQAMTQAAAQQMHLRRYGVPPNGTPNPAVLPALAQHAAATRPNPTSQQQRAVPSQGQGQPQTTKVNPSPLKSPTTVLAQPRQPQSSPPQAASQSQPPFPQQNPGISATTQQAQPQVTAPLGLGQQNNPHVSTTMPPINMDHVRALQQRGFTADQIKNLIQQSMAQYQARFAAQQQQLMGNGGNTQVQTAIQAQMQQSRVQIINGRQIWAGAIKWHMTDSISKQRRTIEAHITATPVDGQESAAKLDLWPADFDLSAADLTTMPPNALQDYMRSLTVPVVIITPVENPSTGNDRRFHALWQLLLSKHLAATVHTQFTGMPSTRRGIVIFASPSVNSQKLFAAVYIDHDLPEFPNARTSQQQQQQQQQQQKQQQPQQQQSHPQQAPPAAAPPVPRGPVPPLTSQKYAQYIQQNMARAAQLQQQDPGVNGLAAQQQANALGFMPGLPGAGVGAFNPGGGAIQPTFPGNLEMTAQFQALRQQQQHQQQRFGGGQQPPPGFLNMGGSNGSAGAGSSGAAMTLDLLNSLLGAK